jgi:hypothetical protein
MLRRSLLARCNVDGSRNALTLNSPFHPTMPCLIPEAGYPIDSGTHCRWWWGPACTLPGRISRAACWSSRSAWLWRRRTLRIWPSSVGADAFRCPKCESNRSWPTGRAGLLECAACHSQVSVAAGTILEGTRKPLGLWLRAMWACHEREERSERAQFAAPVRV